MEKKRSVNIELRTLEISSFEVKDLYECIDFAKDLLGRINQGNFKYRKTGGKMHHRHTVTLTNVPFKTTKVIMKYAGQDTDFETVVVKFKTARDLDL